MPPKLTLPTTDLPTPTPLIPDPDANPDTDSTTFAGIPVVAAKQQTRDAFNVLFYAYPGVGKTTISGMFAEYPPARDVLVVDAEGGASVLAHLDNVYIAQVKRWQDVERILTHIERTPTDALPYRTIIWDNVTEMHAMLVQSIAGNGPVEIQQHGIITAALLRFTRRVRDLSRFRGINTVLLAWQDNKEDKSRGLTRQVVALTDKLSARLPGVPNNVGYITILNNPPLYTRKISFAASPLNDAKFRRPSKSEAPAIPLEIYYGIDQNPILDMLRTVYEDVPFPAEKYERPKGRRTNTPANATTTDEGDSA